MALDMQNFEMANEYRKAISAIQDYLGQRQLCDELAEELRDGAEAIDALLIFSHQHTQAPLLREIAVLNRIKALLAKHRAAQGQREGGR